MDKTATATSVQILTAPVVIYTGDDCHWCGKAKTYLTQRGVPYTEKQADADEVAAREVEALTGQRKVPVIVVGDQVIIGFQRRKLDALLNLATLDAATESTLPGAQDALAAAAAAGRLTWTPEQEAQAGAIVQQMDPEAICGYLAGQLDYNLARCDHTFRHVSAFLAVHPPAAADPAALLAQLQTLGITCDCGYVINVCMR